MKNIKTSPNSEHLQTTVNVNEKLNLFWDGLKTSQEKEKMLVFSIFSFSHNIFKPVVKSQDCVANKKLWTSTKLKAFANDKFNGAKMMISVFDSAENIVGKGENAGKQRFLLFPRTMFSKTSVSVLLKDGIV